jgi:hypothetical protein
MTNLPGPHREGSETDKQATSGNRLRVRKLGGYHKTAHYPTKIVVIFFFQVTLMKRKTRTFRRLEGEVTLSGLEQAQEGLDHAHHASSHAHESPQTAGHIARFPVLVGLMVGILAVALALTESEVRSANDDYLTNHIGVSDTWAFFQAKNQRKTVYLATVTILENLPDQSEKVKAQIAEYRAEAGRMDDDPKTGEGRKQLAAKATEQTKIRDHAHHVGDQLERSVGLLQIAIVLASLSIVAKMKPLALGAGMLGFGAAVYAALVHLGKV